MTFLFTDIEGHAPLWEKFPDQMKDALARHDAILRRHIAENNGAVFSTGGSRTALRRQQTLRSLIDWSHDLLSDMERTLLRRLPVFSGGWDREAAEEVCSGGSFEGPAAMDHLMQLVEKTLVVVTEKGSGLRCRLLETMRQYARDKLLASGEASQLRDRHRDRYLRFAETAGTELRGKDQPRWYGIIDADMDNVRAAFEWSAVQENGAEKAFRIASALDLYWEGRGSMTEGLDWLERMLTRDDGVTPKARAETNLRLADVEYFHREPAGSHSCVRAIWHRRRCMPRERSLYTEMSRIFGD